MPDPQPTPPEQAVPNTGTFALPPGYVILQQPAGTVAGQAVATGERVVYGLARMTPQAIQNILFFIAIIGFFSIGGGFLYWSRRDNFEMQAQMRADQKESMQLILRHNESQAELNRQVVLTQNQTLQQLTVQVGELKQVVSNLDKTVHNLKNKTNPEDVIAPEPRLKCPDG